MFRGLAKLMRGRVAAHGENHRVVWGVVHAFGDSHLFLTVEYNDKTKLILNPTRKQMKLVRENAWDLYHSPVAGERVI